MSTRKMGVKTSRGLLSFRARDGVEFTVVGPKKMDLTILKQGGTLVLGTPDYQHRTWRIIEALYRVAAPGGYADEHIIHRAQSGRFDRS